MPVKRIKAGPKSSKTIHGLGDSSDESSDKENDSRQTTQISVSQFQTPAVPSETTDYELEYDSRPTDISPRASSTLRSSNVAQRRYTRGSVRDRSQTVSESALDQLNNQPTHHVVPALTGRRVKQRFPLNRETRMLKEMHDLWKRTTPLIPRLCFSRVVRDILLQQSMEITRMTRAAIVALQEATEMYMTQRFEDAYMLTLHRGLVTLQLKDLKMVNYLLDRR